MMLWSQERIHEIGFNFNWLCVVVVAACLFVDPKSKQQLQASKGLTFYFDFISTLIALLKAFTTHSELIQKSNCHMLC